MPITEQLWHGRRGWRRWGFAAASVVVHAGLLAALVVATADEDAAAAEEPGDEDVTFVDIREFAPPPPPAPAAAQPEPQPEPVQPQPTPTPQPRPEPRAPEPQVPPRPTDIVDPVDSLPDEPLGADAPPEPVTPIAPPTVAPSPATGGQAGGQQGGVEGGKAGGVVGGQGDKVPEPGGTYIAAVVDRQAELSNRSDLPRLMQRLYPPALRDAGIGGRVVVQFVVTPKGRVDMSTVKVMSASHDGFVEATREALREFRFRPARMGDRTVRMLTQLPVVWEVQR